MEEKRSPFTKRLGIAATIVSLTGGSIALWNQLKPVEELPDLSGTWVITDRIDTATDATYIGNTHEYQVSVIQDGDKFDGSGTQKKYNGRYAKGRWRIDIKGKLTEEGVRATFHVTNPDGGFDGSLFLKPDENDTRAWTGTIRTTVAAQQGLVHVRVEP